MSTTLCFDFGNTRLKAAIFIKKELVEVRILENGTPQEMESLLNEFHPEKTILSSVIHYWDLQPKSILPPLLVNLKPLELID